MKLQFLHTLKLIWCVLDAQKCLWFWDSTVLKSEICTFGHFWEGKFSIWENIVKIQLMKKGLFNILINVEKTKMRFKVKSNSNSKGEANFQNFIENLALKSNNSRQKVFEIIFRIKLHQISNGNYKLELLFWKFDPKTEQTSVCNTNLGHFRLNQGQFFVTFRFTRFGICHH